MKKIMAFFVFISCLSANSAWSIPSFPSDTKAFIQLNGKLKPTIAPNTTAIDVDLFDTKKSKITSLKGSGKKVICYFSAGSFEIWRKDATSFKKADYGKGLEGWDNEYWLNINSSNVKKIMKKRIALAKSKGCDAVDPDNVDGYTQNSGFTITADQQLAYNKFLADEAHRKGLAIGLKNSPDQAQALASYFDFSVVEQCHQYNECKKYLPFKNANKAIFNLEYNSKYKASSTFQKMCKTAKKYGMHSAVYDLGLKGKYYKSCP